MSIRVGGRVEWVDLVKGVAILLVVLYHAATLALQNGLAHPVWVQVDAALTAFRMPLFFFASGLFAGSVIKRSWAQLWRSRIALLVWMFLLWSVLRFAYFTLVPMPERPGETSLSNLLLSPLKPMSGLWFLHALVVFFVFAKLARRIPVWVQLAGATVLSTLFFSVLSAGNLSYNGMARYALFFLLGLHLRKLVLARSAAPRPVLASITLLGFIAVTVGVTFGQLAEVPGVMTALGVVAVVTGILGGRALAETALARPLTFLGRNTLPVYVTHVILVAAGIAVVEASGAPMLPSLAGVFPLLLAALALAISLLVARAVQNTSLRFLYEAPPVLLRMPGRRRIE